MLIDHPEDAAVAAVERWVRRLVVGLNLCPFAAPVLRAGAARFVRSDAADLEALLGDVVEELERLLRVDAEELATTLIVVPDLLHDFDDYLDALALIDAALAEAGLEGEVQVASFHPDYRFEGEDPDDPSHLTNRSPHPVFHLLREDQVADAVARHPDAEGIPARNIAKLRQLGVEGVRKLLAEPG